MKIEIKPSLKKKILLICHFCNTTPTIINGSSRKIDNYFSNISSNDKNDLACEIIIELGDKDYWDKKDKEFKIKMVNVYTKQVKDLDLLLPNFKVASAIIHFDETSPHMHIVGVPIKDKNKNGMAKQVGKSTVFTKESLKFFKIK